MKTKFYEVTHDLCVIECFKLSDRDELKEPAFEVLMTTKDGTETSLEAYQPQAAIALADEVIKGLN